MSDLEMGKIDEFNKEAGEIVVFGSHGIIESILVIGLYLLRRIKKLEKTTHTY